MRDGCRHLVFNLLTIVLILGGMEVVSRIALKKVYNREFDSQLIQEGKYGETDGLKANATGTVWGKEFNTDAFGCRKNSKPFNPKKKKRLFIGDSVTEGVGVDDSSTFEALVSASIDSVNVMNYSLIGYSVSDYYNVLQTVLSKEDAGSRVTIFYCLNDVYGAAKTKDLPVMAKQNLRGRLNAFLQDKYATYKLVKLILFRNADRYYQYDKQFYAEDNSWFKETMTLLQSCDSLCRANGVKMDMVILPYRSQLHGKEGKRDAPQTLLASYAGKYGIQVHNPLETLKKAHDARSFYLFSDEIHLSEEGHKAITRFILSH